MATDIEPGSRTAWTVKLLLTAWIAQDGDKVDAVLSLAEADHDEVLRYLVALIGGQVSVLAALLRVPCDAALERVLQVLALTDDNVPGHVMREAVTIWTHNGGGAADALAVAGTGKVVASDKLMAQFLSTAVVLTHLVARISNSSPWAVTESWWQLLGTTS